MLCLLEGYQVSGLHGSRPLQIVERKFFDNWNEFEDNKLRMELELQPLADDAEVDFDTPAGAKGSGFLQRVSLPCLPQLLAQSSRSVRASGVQTPRADVCLQQAQSACSGA